MIGKFSAALALLLCTMSAIAQDSKPALVLEGFENNVRGLSVSADGKRVIATGDDQTLRVWDLASGKQTLKAAIPSQARLVKELQGGKRIIIAGEGGPLQILEATTGKLVKELAKSSYSAAISNDDKLLAVGIVEDVPTVELFALPGGSKLRKIEIEGEPAALSISSDGALLAVGLSRGKPENVVVVNTKTGKIVAKVTHGDKQVGVGLSPDGKTLASYGEFPANFGVQLWNVKTGVSTSVVGTNDTPGPSTFSPDGKSFAILMRGKLLKIDTASAKLAGAYAESRDLRNVIAFTPDGKRILVANLYAIEVWDIAP